MKKFPKKKNINKLVFQSHPNVEFGGNIFINVPVILQFDDQPLIEVKKVELAGFTTEIPIFHEDGTYLAKAVGSSLYRTPDGEKAGLRMRRPDKKHVCELNGRTLFVMERTEAAALKTEAELYTPTGVFVRYSAENHVLDLPDGSSKGLEVQGVKMIGNRFMGCDIGILVTSDGKFSIGANKRTN